MNENQLRSCFEQRGPTTGQKERMMERILSRNEEKRRPARVHWGRMAMAAAVTACLLATAAFAAKVAGLDQRLLELLGAGEQAEALAAGAQVVDKTVNNAGSSLTVREVLGDRDNLYILLNFTAPEGTVLDAYDYRFRDSDLTYDSRENWYCNGYTKLEDPDSGDNSLDLVLQVTTDRIPADGNMTLRLEDLEAASGYGEPFVSLGLPGTWKVSFPLEYTDCSRTETALQEPVTLYGQEAAVTEVSLSPLSVTVKGSGGALREAVEAARAAEKEGWFPVTVRFRDGSGFTTSREAGDGYTCLVQYPESSESSFYVNWTFHKVIDPEQVEAIEFFGASIPVG